MSKVLLIDHKTRQSLNIASAFAKAKCDVFETDNNRPIESQIMKYKPDLILLSGDFEKQHPGLLDKIKEINRCPLVVYSDIFTKPDIVKYFSYSVDKVLVDPVSQIESLLLFLAKPDK